MASEAELPIPLPDVPGADAGPRGLPSRSELTPLQRAIVDSSAVIDLGLRTAIASLIGVAVLPTVATGAIGRSSSRRERAGLEFYAALAQNHDPELSFPAPTDVPKVRARLANPIAEYIAHGNVHNISFPSTFRTVDPAAQPLWNSFDRNNRVWAQHWRHDDGPRPTLCLIHGFMGSAYFFNGLFFSLPWFYRTGYDVLLLTLPFHGRRAERGSPFSGYGYFAHGLTGFAEAMAQAVHDFRSILNWLCHNGVNRIALTGMSLGGYTSALAASVDERLQAVIPNVPVVKPEAAFDDWWPASKIVSTGRTLAGITREHSLRASAYHSPLNYQPKVPKERRLIITGLGDRLAPPDQAEALWEHWDRCALHWFPGNHILHVSQPEYLRRMTRFLRPVMFD
jgi:pimeloyl-ACP methyl ester carboxylesterase